MDGNRAVLERKEEDNLNHSHLIMAKTKKTIDTSRSEMEDAVQDNLMGLTAAALSSSLGDIRILKGVPDGDSGNLKYRPIKDEDEIITALGWIAKYGNKIGEQGFFILQQDKPDMRAWDMLVNRLLGKVAEQVKIDTKITAFIGVAQAAVEARQARKINGTLQDTLPPNIIKSLPTAWAE